MSKPHIRGGVLSRTRDGVTVLHIGRAPQP